MRHCVLCTPLLRSTRGACPSSSSVTNGAHSTYPHLLPYISGESFTLLHPFFDRITQSSYCPLTRTHWHSETLSNLSRLSLARTLGPIQRLELAGARFFTAFSGTHSFLGPVTPDVFGGNNRTIIVASQGVKTSEPRQRQGAQECGCRDRLRSPPSPSLLSLCDDREQKLHSTSPPRSAPLSLSTFHNPSF